MQARVLIAARYWPPAGLGHGHRVGKLSKFLNRNGQVHVTGVCGPTPPNMPRDQVLWTEAQPESLTVVPDFHPRHGSSGVGAMRRRISRVASPIDVHYAWAVRSAHILSTATGTPRLDACITSGPPHTAHIIGSKLRELRGIPHVVDLRDPLIRHSDASRFARIHHQILGRRSLERIITSADAILANSPGNAHDLMRDFPQAAPRIHVVPNGFDPDEFTRAAGPPASHKIVPRVRPFRLVYAGGLRHGTPPYEEPLYRVLRELDNRHPAAASQVEVILMGTDEDEAQVRASFNPRHIDLQVCPLTGSRTAAGIIQSATMGVVIIPYSESEAHGWIPLKVYSYLGAGISILPLVPPGDCLNLCMAAGQVLDPGGSPSDTAARVAEAIDRSRVEGHGTVNRAAAEHSWTRRAEKLTSIIGELSS